jgi:hypothetical protein
LLLGRRPPQLPHPDATRRRGYLKEVDDNFTLSKIVKLRNFSSVIAGCLIVWVQRGE